MDGKRRGDADKTAPPGPCGSCGEAEQTNWLQFTGEKKDMPWIEIAPLSSEEAAKKEAAADAAKRAEIEANVRKALAERTVGAGDASSKPQS